MGPPIAVSLPSSLLSGAGDLTSDVASALITPSVAGAFEAMGEAVISSVASALIDLVSLLASPPAVSTPILSPNLSYITAGLMTPVVAVGSSSSEALTSPHAVSVPSASLAVPIWTPSVTLAPTRSANDPYCCT